MTCAPIRTLFAGPEICLTRNVRYAALPGMNVIRIPTAHRGFSAARRISTRILSVLAELQKRCYNNVIYRKAYIVKLSMKSNKYVKYLLLLTGVLLLLLTGSVYAEEAKEITKYCSFRASSGNTKWIVDRSTKTVWYPSGEDGTCYICLPETGMGYLLVEWNIAPDETCAVTQYHEDQTEIVSVTPNGNMVQVFPLDESAKYVFIRIRQKGQGLCGVRLYSEGDLPESVQNWELPYEKCDLMVISTHQDDEWLWFGGTIPYYEYVMDKRVQVVYMAYCSRTRYKEALNGLWLGGVRHFPEFLGFKDERIDSMNKAVSDWGGADLIVQRLVETIRRYKPEVILTHDWNGEYKHVQHIITSRAMDYAIEAAADSTRYPDSANEYGTWQVKKLYRHLWKEGQIRFEWTTKYPELKGYSPLDICKEAYKCHEAYGGFFKVENHGRYDNALFGLSYSCVGEDRLHKDLFENISDGGSVGEESSADADGAEPAGESEGDMLVAEDIPLG